MSSTIIPYRQIERNPLPSKIKVEVDRFTLQALYLMSEYVQEFKASTPIQKCMLTVMDIVVPQIEKKYRKTNRAPNTKPISWTLKYHEAYFLDQWLSIYLQEIEDNNDGEIVLLLAFNLKINQKLQ